LLGVGDRLVCSDFGELREYEESFRDCTEEGRVDGRVEELSIEVDEEVAEDCIGGEEDDSQV